MADCSHPFHETRNLKVLAKIEGSYPINKRSIVVCTECGSVVSVDGEKTEDPVFKLRANDSCDHPYDRIEEKEIVISTTGNGYIIAKTTVEVCNSCNHTPVSHEIPLNEE